MPSNRSVPEGMFDWAPEADYKDTNSSVTLRAGRRTLAVRAGGQPGLMLRRSAILRELEMGNETWHWPTACAA